MKTITDILEEVNKCFDFIYSSSPHNFEKNKALALGQINKSITKILDELPTDEIINNLDRTDTAYNNAKREIKEHIKKLKGDI